MYSRVTQRSTSGLESTQITLGIGMLNNIFPVHTKTHTIVSSIPMCYDECHNVNIYSPKEVTTFVDE